jgi:hypothetical protein
LLLAIVFAPFKLEKRPQLDVRKASMERFYEKTISCVVNKDD